MSQEKVEIVRVGFEAFNRGDAMVTESFHRDVEWHDQRELPGSTVHHGIEAVQRHLAATREAWEYYRADLLEIVDVGPSVVAVYQIHARGRLSGATVERDAVFVHTFRGAKVERVEIFGTKSEALEAVGLRE